MKQHKYRIQINLANSRTMFFDTSKVNEICDIKETFNTLPNASEFLVYANMGKGYEMIERINKRRIGF